MTLEIVGLRIIVDMNLSPSWVGFLLSKGISAEPKAAICACKFMWRWRHIFLIQT